MTTQNLQTKLLFSGGWSTDFGPSAPVSIGEEGIIQIPFLINADNVIYELDGGPRKIEGTTRINSTTIASGASIRGLVDYWILGTGSAATQHRVCYAGTKIYKDDADGTFASISDSLAARDSTSVPSFAEFDDELILMTDANEAPLKWTGSGDVVALGTNTPLGSFGVTHKNRFWMAGVRTAKSRLFYSEPLPNGADGDWNAVEAGFIDVDPGDGDEIRGLISFKGELWVFKGPYLGSIHRIAGDTPLGGVTAFASSTQPQPFIKTIFIRGLGAAGHNSIFRFKDDVGFINGATGSIHSLNATAAFGDFREAALSFPINNFLRDRVNQSELKKAWAAANTSRGCVLTALSIDAATDNNQMLCMDHRFDPVRWAPWPVMATVGKEPKCLAMVIDSVGSNRAVPFIGDTSGFIRKLEQPNRSLDGETSINYKVTLPFLDFGNPVAFKTFARGSVGIQPKGSYNGTFSWTRDGQAQQSTTFTQSGEDVLGGGVTSGSFTFVSEAGSLIRITAAGHTLSTGDKVALSASTVSAYDGSYTVVSTTASTFDVAATFVSPATGTWAYDVFANFFVLGSSALGGTRFVDRFFSLEEGGEFRSIQFEVTQNGVNQDMELHHIFAEVEPGADSTENT